MKKITKIMVACMLIAGSVFTASCSANEKLVMATNAAFPPFEFVTDEGLVGQFDGIDVAIALEIANELGKELQIENMEFTSVLQALPNGKADIVIAGLSIKPDRIDAMDFSTPYYSAVQYILVKEDDASINSAADLADKKVGAISGYTGYVICDEELGLADLSGYKRSTDAVLDLKNGKIDALVIDSHTALAIIRENTGLKYVDDSEVFALEEYAIGVKKGNQEMLDTVNKVLADLTASGKLQEIFTKYSTESFVEDEAE